MFHGHAPVFVAAVAHPMLQPSGGAGVRFTLVRLQHGAEAQRVQQAALRGVLGVDFARARGVVRTKGRLEPVGGTTQKTRRCGA